MNGNIVELSYSCFGDSSFFLIWYEDKNSKDRVYTSGGKVVSFWKEEEVRQKAEQFGITVIETCFFDVERLDYWIAMHQKEIACEFLIDFWNLFSDIAYSVGKELEPIKTRRLKRCYNKLFWGLNLPAATPEGCEYEPVFTKRERKLIREVMHTGMEIYRENHIMED